MIDVLVIDLKMKNDKFLSSERFRDLLCFSFILFIIQEADRTRASSMHIYKLFLLLLGIGIHA